VKELAALNKRGRKATTKAPTKVPRKVPPKVTIKMPKSHEEAREKVDGDTAVPKTKPEEAKEKADGERVDDDDSILDVTDQ